MNVAAFTLGMILVVAVLVDVLWTTLWVDKGAGPLARVLMRAIRRVFGWVGGRERPTLRSLAAPAILAGSVAVWVLLLWMGWVMVFAAEPASLVQATTRAPADLVGRVYFVGYSLFTLGNGDFTPQGHLWQALTAVASGTGIFVLTLAITYLLSVLSAQVEQRSLASLVLGLGGGPAALVKTLRGDGSWAGFDKFAFDVSARFGQTSEKHLAYPVLHFLVSSTPEKSPTVALAVLDEAVRIMRHGLAPDEQPPPPLPVAVLKSSIDTYLETMASSLPVHAHRVPPATTLAPLREAGVEVVPDSAFESRVSHEADRRRKLLALLEEDGWTWQDTQK